MLPEPLSSLQAKALLNEAEAVEATLVSEWSLSAPVASGLRELEALV